VPALLRSAVRDDDDDDGDDDDDDDDDTNRTHCGVAYYLLAQDKIL